jgi:hypothetical protein
MQPLPTLREKVAALYNAGNPAADPCVDWGYTNHVLWVANKTAQLAEREGARTDLAVAGALLHDIADAVMTRKNPAHEEKSRALAGQLLQESGFSREDTDFIVNEIIGPHSCRERMPTTLEGKVMATADGAAHFLTDFYAVFLWRHYGPRDDYPAFREWALKKLEKDITKKFFFADVKADVLPQYEALKRLFSYGV